MSQREDKGQRKSATNNGHNTLLAKFCELHLDIHFTQKIWPHGISKWAEIVSCSSAMYAIKSRSVSPKFAFRRSGPLRILTKVVSDRPILRQSTRYFNVIARNKVITACCKKFLRCFDCKHPLLGNHPIYWILLHARPTMRQDRDHTTFLAPSNNFNVPDPPFYIGYHL